jgi:flagellar biosynthesis protein FlhF
MQVKIFRAENMQQALRQVKEAFGHDALILSTRTVRKQPFGFMRAPELEVTAAVENTTETQQSNQKSEFRQELKTQVNGLSQGPDGTYDQKGRLHGEKVLEKDSPVHDPASVTETEIRSLHNEMRELRRLLTSNPGIRTLHTAPVHAPEAKPEVRFLMDKGISRQAAESIVSHAACQTIPDAEKQSDLASWCKQQLASWVQVTNGITSAQNKGKRIAFLGPTGVGKTTTMAKLAAHYLQNQGRDILLVTIDNYRVAAAEQLQIYAQIMNIPLKVISTPEQLNTVLRRHGVNKLTLIDTAGRNPRDEQSLQELEDFLGQGQGFDKYLVLSATTKDEDLVSIADRFSPLGLDGLVFTKLDETCRYASLINMQHQTGCPLTYLTAGQNVPEDLQPADPEHISKIIIHPGETTFHDGQTSKK